MNFKIDHDSFDDKSQDHDDPDDLIKVRTMMTLMTLIKIRIMMVPMTMIRRES